MGRNEKVIKKCKDIREKVRNWEDKNSAGITIVPCSDAMEVHNYLPEWYLSGVQGLSRI